MAVLTTAGITFGDSTTQSTAALAVSLRTTVFASSSSFVPPAGVTKITITCIGGGGGAGTQFSRSCGMGGVAFGEISVVPGTTYLVTVGAGGVVGNSGTAGGESFFGVDSSTKLISATGGAGGVAGGGAVANGAGANGTVVNSNIAFTSNSSINNFGSTPENTGCIGVFAGRTYRTSGGTGAIAWSPTNNMLPGASGYSESSTGDYRGGVGGAISIQYAGT